MGNKIAWSKKLSPGDLEEVCRVSQVIKIDPSWLMACMYFESGGTFSPSIFNKAGSGAIGIIQFTKKTAELQLHTTIGALSKMTFIEQMKYVEKYFFSYVGKLHRLYDVYFAILWPAAIGRPDDYVLFDKNNPDHKLYAQNKGLDFNHDGHITVTEVCTKIKKIYDLGMLPENCV